MAVDNHAPTRGDIARYLSVERADVDLEKLGDRFEYWREHGELPGGEES